jgi:hypothetical protein
MPAWLDPDTPTTELDVCETWLHYRSSWELNSHVIGCSKLEKKLTWLHITRLLLEFRLSKKPLPFTATTIAL